MLDQKELKKKQMQMFNDLIDEMCESKGVRNVINDMLCSRGFTKEELLAMSFGEDDIDQVLEAHKNIQF